MTSAILFFSTFLLVLCLGLQQLNVMGGHRVPAFFTSAGIGCANLVVLKYVPGPTDAWDLLGYLLGGPFGVVTSMMIHPRMVHLFRKVAS